jgi:hypothetical protein
MNEEKPLSSPANTIDIFPLGKGKRILLALADYFLYFIFGIFIFTIAAFPLSRLAANADALEEKNNANTAAEVALLYSNNLLSQETAGVTNFDSDLAYSQKQFVIASLSGSTANNPFYVFYVEKLGKSAPDLVQKYKSYDKTPFFSSILDANGLPTFLEKYQSEFAPLSDPKNTLTSQGEKDYTAFSSAFFLPFYQTIIVTLSSGEGLAPGDPLLAYHDYAVSNVEIKAGLDRALIYACYATYLFTGAILFVAVPLINSKGKTLGMVLLREVRLGSDNLDLLPRGERALTSIYELVLNLSFVPFLPLAYFASVTNFFDLPALDIVALVSLLFALASLIVLLTHPYNKDLLDVASRSVVVSDDDYLTIDQARAYGRKN